MHKRKYYLLVILLGTIGIIVMEIRLDQVDNALSTIAYRIVDHTEKLIHPIQAWYYRPATVPLLTAKLVESEQVRIRLTAELCKAHALLKEIQNIGPLAAFCDRYDPHEYVVGRVIKIVTTADEHSLIIDAGTRHGIEPGMIAVAHNCIVGYVQTAFPYYAKIMLITDRRSKIPVQCSMTKTTGIYSGMNRGDKGSLLFVSHLDTVQEGDIVLTSGDGITYPAGFCIGTITQVTHNPHELHYTIDVNFLHDITTLRHVAILKRPQCP